MKRRMVARTFLIVPLAVSIAIALRYAPKAILLSLMVFAMNDTGEPLWRIGLLQMQFLFPLLLFIAAIGAAAVGLKRPSVARILMTVGLTALALTDAIFVSTAW